jgi:DNA invertase Pin-like site-specific DNA recombinase
MNLRNKDKSHPHIYAGVGFVRSRKPECRIMDFCEEMKVYAERNYIALIDIVVDRGDEVLEDGTVDLDRLKINKLFAWMQKDYVKVIFIRNLNEITTNKEDQHYFLIRAEELGVSVHSIEAGINLETGEEFDISDLALIWDGGSGC